MAKKLIWVLFISFFICIFVYKSERFGKSEDIVKSDNETCSAKAGQRGPGQKVVAFTFFSGPTFDGRNRNYFRGIASNLELIQGIYGPGWTMRLYYQVQKDSQSLQKLQELARQHPHLDLCDIQHNPMMGNMSSIYPLIWRFLPVLDPQVDVYLSRDLDSNITQRESEAVQEFLRSGEDFHIMRDHPHQAVEILGGMWGAKLQNPSTRANFVAAFAQMANQSKSFRAPRNEYMHDQTILRSYVWPWAKKIALVHDSYHCQAARYKAAKRIRPFPTRRDMLGNFVGSPASLNETLACVEANHCPLACRKRPEWLFC